MSTNPPTYMFVFRRPTEAPELSEEESNRLFGSWMAWVAALRAKGGYIAGDPLEASPAKVVRGPKGAQISDGPFVEAKEVVGGYVLLTAASFEEAAELSRGCPDLPYGGTVEVRQIMPIPM